MEYSVDAAVLDGWNITRLLGEGSYGKVFEIERSEFGQHAGEPRTLRYRGTGSGDLGEVSWDLPEI